MLTLLKILANIWSIITNAINAGLTWIKENPKLAAAIFILLVSNLVSAWYSYGWGVDKTTAKYAEIIKEKDVLISKYEADIQERDTKIKQVEADSKIAADKAKSETDKKAEQLTVAQKEFARRLDEERKKRQTGTQSVTVVNPATQDNVNVTLEGNEVVCSRFHDAFVESVNEMIKVIYTVDSSTLAPATLITVPHTVGVENTPQSIVESPGTNRNLTNSEKTTPTIPIEKTQ